MKRILIIEDDPIVTLVYERFLLAHNFEVTIAKNGAIGLEKLEYFHPDAILLDLMMPKVNGLQVIQAVRSNPAHLTIPILVMTAAAVPTLVREAIEAGANRIFDKANDKPLAVVNYLHDLLQTTSSSQLIAPSKCGNLDAVLDQWPNKG